MQTPPDSATGSIREKKNGRVDLKQDRDTRPAIMNRDDMDFHQLCDFISRKTSCIILGVTLSLLICPSILHSEQFNSTGTTSVYFSPNGGVTEAIVNQINSAKSEILVQAQGDGRTILFLMMTCRGAA
jgi:hypothetical protein